MKHLISVPSGMVNHFHKITGFSEESWFVSNDPGLRKLGSGGGTAHLLTGLFNRETTVSEFHTWLRSEKRIIIHAGGKSRRLPAYAPSGKSLIPVPVFRWSRGQKIGQRLIDLQVPLFDQIINEAPVTLNTLIASGDVLIRRNMPLPRLPEADVVCFGMWLSPEMASGHGVFFAKQNSPGKLEFMLQKPSVEVIRQYVHTHFFLMDIGIWLLSNKAVEVLMKKCGWTGNQFTEGFPADYDLYGSFGPALGADPTLADSEINELTSALVNLENGEFYHFGNSSELISSNEMLQNKVLDQRMIWNKKIKPHPSVFMLNSPGSFRPAEDNHSVWIENSVIPGTWKLSSRHVLTGIPENRWNLSVSEGVCLDVVPLPDKSWVLRNYGFHDRFSESSVKPGVQFMNEPFDGWLRKRGLQQVIDQHDPYPDLQSFPLFPVIDQEEDGTFIQWLIDCDPQENAGFSDRWLNNRRYSADELNEFADIARLEAQRHNNLLCCLSKLGKNYKQSVFYQLDLEDLSEKYAVSELTMPEEEPDGGNSFNQVYFRMFRAEVLRKKEQLWHEEEEQAFRHLRDSIVDPVMAGKNTPSVCLLEDQITWARSPVRLDLAGGWSDTPPYCILYGGQVVNIAVELNGQPPLQCFVRRRPQPEIVLRSIDLGMEEIIENYDQVNSFREVQSAFSIPRAALALSGFLPDFCGTRFPDLKTQLTGLGGGLEITILSAVPKGSGLGTSSILAATVLGALSDACCLNWDKTEICNRTLALEQMLTTGGGWQDQYGGILYGIKYLETIAGYEQIPMVKWLPDALFTKPEFTGSILLYYTGITRVAKTILGDIVRGMFLNSSKRLPVIHEIREHGRNTFDTLQHNDFNALGEMIGRSWMLNQMLDSGTNTPEIGQIISRIEPYCIGMKLLGAGGGGYMLVIARDVKAAFKIRGILTENPPNNRARFVEMQLSTYGLQVSRS